ncbi:MAG: hypothetical protein P4L85_26090 [Paludisphaera borealis]|uniref:hypothetical protein n=1 Tax=Paludisphaera borealis TaxID=1387353 RepID=UPI002840DD21|nr:hypothetical protein [Paludisphaera borealis]MDR3622851.1 hypothetical protein [Paludisphaera borealis]
MILHRRAAMLAALLLPFAGSGCGGVPEAAAKLSTTVPVQGKVTYKGKPLTHGTVVFEPDAGREAHGEIGPDGGYTLSTFKAGDGAVAGKHRVSISGLNKKDLPLKYHAPSSSAIEFEVGADKSDYPIDLK